MNTLTQPARPCQLARQRHFVACTATRPALAASRRPAVLNQATTKQDNSLTQWTLGTAAVGGFLAAATLVTSAPALAASYKPNTIYNNTDYVVEAQFKYKQDASCKTPSDVGKIKPGFMLTFPHSRGSCAINEMTATAFKESGASSTPVATVRWRPTDPNSQAYPKWAVLQMKNQTPSIQVVHIMD